MMNFVFNILYFNLSIYNLILLIAVFNNEFAKFLSLIYFLLRYSCFKENAMATHSSTLAWKIPWTEEPGRLQSMGSRRVGLD